MLCLARSCEVWSLGRLILRAASRRLRFNIDLSLEFRDA